MTWTYASQRMSYPVVNDIRVCITKNISGDGWHEYVRITKNVLSCGRQCKNTRHKKYFTWQMTRMYASQRMSYPVANDIRVRVTKNILQDGWRECTRHKESYPVADDIRMRVTKNILCGGWCEYHIECLIL